MTEEIFRQDSYAKTCEATVVRADEQGIALDRTVFYPLGGGQAGDTGKLIWDGGETAITDTRKGDQAGEILHIPEPGAALPPVGAKATAEIDWARRHRLMRMHTCLHLLCAVIEGDVTGGSISDGRGRLDFNLPNTQLDKDAITAELNRLIAEDHPATPRWIDDAELEANPSLVRTMSVKPPMGSGKVRLLDIDGVDLQPCGGTHVQRTGEIGKVMVTKIENKGKQNRRINLAFAD